MKWDEVISGFLAGGIGGFLAVNLYPNNLLAVIVLSFLCGFFLGDPIHNLLFPK